MVKQKKKNAAETDDGTVAVADTELPARTEVAPMAMPGDSAAGGSVPAVGRSSSIGAPPFLGDRSGGDRPSPGGGGGYRRMSEQGGRSSRTKDGDPRRKMSELLNREKDSLMVLDHPFMSRVGPEFTKAFWALCEAFYKEDRKLFKAGLAAPDPLGTCDNMATRIAIELFAESTSCWRGDAPVRVNPRSDLVNTLRTRFMEAEQAADGGPDLTWFLRRVVGRVVFVDAHIHSVVLRCGLFADIADFNAVLAALADNDPDVAAEFAKMTKRYKTAKKTWASREEQRLSEHAERLAEIQAVHAPRLALLDRLNLSIEEFLTLAEFIHNTTTPPMQVSWRHDLHTISAARKAAASAPAAAAG